jgi:UDP-N-acetylmuramoylalanine--D-glutamate ligase
MIPRAWRQGEVAVVGLGASGRAATELLVRDGLRVYASDASSSDGAARTAAALGRLGASIETGGHDLARIARAAVVVASPGVPPDAAPLVRARAAGVPVVSEIEVGLRYLPTATRYIAITGTNGKTTTTAMVGHLLRAIGLTAVDAGNIGTPLTEIALSAAPPAWVSLEVSSFQLHDTPSIAPTVGVLTNLSPDHLDRYASVEDYYGDKGQLFANASGSSKWVLNADDSEVERLVRSVAGARRAGAAASGSSRPLAGVVEFSLARQADAYYDRSADALVVLGAPLLPRRELALFGDHNVANALAASLAVMIADPAHATAPSRARIAAGLKAFAALPHRLESVGEVGGVLWINDSKATNVSSTLVAIAGMTRPTVLLLGGRHKGEPYTALAEPLRRIGRAVIAYGEAGPTVAHDLEGVVPLVQMGSDFESVIAKARSLAQPGDVVLLSPACSS